MRSKPIKASVSKTHGSSALFWGLLACFLLGTLFLFILAVNGKITIPTQGAASLLADRQEGNWLKIYGQSYFSFFLQASLLLAAGLSGLGIFLLPLLFLAYGGSALYEILSLYFLQGTEGLIQYWQLFWIPNLGKLLLLCLVGTKAFGTALALGKGVLKGPDKTEQVHYKPTLLRYLLCLVAATPVSASGVLLGILFL